MEEQPPQTVQLSRRSVLEVAGALAAASLVPTGAQARDATPADARQQAGNAADIFGRNARVFRIEETDVNPDGKKVVKAVTVNGGLPGPELRYREGELFRVILDNRLKSEPTTLHWHGMLVPAAMDGVPEITQSPVPPGQFFVYEFPIVQSGTYWYHSHYELQEQRGQAGALIIEAKHEPIAYDHDVVLFLSDWLHSNPADIIPNLRRAGATQQTDGAGAMKMSSESKPDLADVNYDAFLLNGRGAVDPWSAQVKVGDRVRLRVINGGASTLFRFGIDDHVLTVTHADGLPVVPIEIGNLLIGMGECYDCLVRVKASGSYTIRAESQDGSGRAIGVLHSSDAAARATPGKPRWDGRPFDYGMLRTREPTAVPPPTKTFSLPLGGNMAKYVWSIGGQVWPDAVPLFVAPGDRVLVEMTNQTPMWHPMHLHGHFFRLLVDGVDPLLAPMKHTALVPPGGTLRFQFLADNPGRWFFHCHNLYHLLAGMAREWTYEVPA